MAGLMAMVAFGGTTGASAAIWAWGCQGQLGGQQVIFNRYSLFVADSKQKMGNLRTLVDEKIDGLVKAPNTRFERVGENDGLESPLKFAHAIDEEPKLTLTERSSKKTSSRSRLICDRDESIDIYRKVYRYERESETARDITMQCIEYMLSTRGGRSC
jgi:hypothetical protein